MVIVFDESPGLSQSDSKEPLTSYPGSAGERLQTIMGLSRKHYLERVMRLYLVDSQSREWPKTQAKEIATAYLEAGFCFSSRVNLVLLGRKVAHAFGLFSSKFFEEQLVDGFRIFVVPHIGSDWYNDSENYHKSQEFFRNLVEIDSDECYHREVFRPYS